LGLRGMRLQQSEYNYITRSLMIRIPYQIFIRVIKPIRMRWARHVARMWERRGPHDVLVGKPEGKDHFVHPAVDWRIILRWILGSGMGSRDLIDLAEDRDRWRVLVNAVMNHRVP